MNRQLAYDLVETVMRAHKHLRDEDMINAIVHELLMRELPPAVRSKAVHDILSKEHPHPTDAIHRTLVIDLMNTSWGFYW